jgi:protein phosphatase
MKVNYYEVLGVERGASEQEIRDRFRKLARENHPDRYNGSDKADAERKFQTLTEAVNVLTNVTRRRQHDSELSSTTSKGTADFAQVARAYLGKGVKAFKEGDFRTAYENFDMAVKHNGQDAKAFHYLALAAVRVPSMARQAVQAIETAVQREPVNATYLKDAGLILKRAGLVAKALIGMQVTAFGLTHVGRQRQHNEDSYLVADEPGLFLVADGMGGHAAGEIASRIAVDSISEFILHTKEDDGTWPHAYDEHYKRSTNRLMAAVRLANTRVLEAMRKDARLRGMGTTVVACLADDDMMSFAHVGDSRAYLIRAGHLSRITNDHSWVFEQVQAGMLTEAEAEKHPLRNVITRALGGALSVTPDASEVETRSGDVYLLCSDGLTGMVPEDEIRDIVDKNTDDLEKACQVLIDTANERGGLDNVTAILVKTT